jgi:hypothetical protein
VSGRAHLSDGTLMLFHDRELGAEEARRVALGKLVDPSVNARLDALSALGHAVRGWAVRAGVDAAAERKRSIRAQGRRRVLTACATLALAAVVLPRVAPTERRAGVDGVREPIVSDMRGGLASVRGPVAVEAVDFGVHPGTIFNVASDAASETTVVWLPDDGS